MKRATPSIIEARAYADGSRDYLYGNNTNSPRYLEWFGVYTSSRYTTVTNHFTAIASAMTNAGINFDCKCKQNYYADVYPNDPYKIYLCRVFWQAPLTGTDSKAGTLIHEMSHFNVVARGARGEFFCCSRTPAAGVRFILTDDIPWAIHAYS